MNVHLNRVSMEDLVKMVLTFMHAYVHLDLMERTVKTVSLEIYSQFGL